MLTRSYNGWDYLREMRNYHLPLSGPFPKIQVRNTSNIYQNNVIALIGINASGKKPSEYCKQIFKNENLKSRKWVKEYFKDLLKD